MLTEVLMLGMLGAPAPVVIDVLARPCAEKPTDADVVVCAPRTPDYRIDPGVLAGQRARNGGPSTAADPREAAIATSCHDLPAKCQGGGVVPLVPVALKTIEAVALAVQGEDWREAFRTKPDEYQAYRAERERRRVRVGIGVSASSGATGRR